MIKLLVKDLVHLDGIGFELMDLQNSLREGDGMLEPRRCQLFVFLHEWPYIVEVTMKEACHDIVFVFVNFITVEVFVIVDQSFQILAHPVI